MPKEIFGVYGRGHQMKGSAIPAIKRINKIKPKKRLKKLIFLGNRYSDCEISASHIKIARICQNILNSPPPILDLHDVNIIANNPKARKPSIFFIFFISKSSNDLFVYILVLQHFETHFPVFSHDFISTANILAGKGAGNHCIY